MFNRSERKLVSTLDEMRSLWQEFVRRKDTDTTVSTVYIYMTICMELSCAYMHSIKALQFVLTAFMLLSVNLLLLGRCDVSPAAERLVSGI